MKGYFDSKFQEAMNLSADANYDIAYEYDVAGRIVKETVTGTINRVVAYTYDENDNITTEVVTLEGKTITKTYTYNESSNITNIAVVVS